MITIDHHKALALLEEVIEGREPFNYRDFAVDDRCTYVRNGEPDCVVGCALARVGVPVENLERLDGYDIPMSIENIQVLDVLQNEGFKLTLDAAHVFQVAQNIQDSGSTWGEALQAARTAYSEIEEIYLNR